MRASSGRWEAKRDALDGRPGGLILALETSGAEGSVAVASWVGSGIWGVDAAERGVGDASEEEGAGTPVGRLQVLARATLLREQEHAALLLPRVAELLEGLGAERSEVTGLVVGSGPGSFTGVRVAAATAKALAWALNVPLWAFSSLAGAVVSGEARGRGFVESGEAAVLSLGGPLPEVLRPRCVLFDARGDRVYAAAFRFAHGSLETLVAPKASTVFEMMDGIIPPGSLLMGEGAVKHRDLLQGAGHTVLPLPHGRPTAEGLLRLLELDPSTPPLADRGLWEPDYLRASGAEQLRKTRKEGEP